MTIRLQRIQGAPDPISKFQRIMRIGTISISRGIVELTKYQESAVRSRVLLNPIVLFISASRKMHGYVFYLSFCPKSKVGSGRLPNLMAPSISAG